MPDGIRPPDEPVPGRRGDRPPAGATSSSRDKDGQRPVYGGTAKFQDDPHWRDYLLFYEYFHGDNGAGLGASHQTGWTGIIAGLLRIFATVTPEHVLEEGKMGYFEQVETPPVEPPAAAKKKVKVKGKGKAKDKGKAKGKSKAKKKKGR